MALFTEDCSSSQYMLLWSFGVVRSELLHIGGLYYSSFSFFPSFLVGQRNMDLLYGLMPFTESH